MACLAACVMLCLARLIPPAWRCVSDQCLPFFWVLASGIDADGFESGVSMLEKFIGSQLPASSFLPPLLPPETFSVTCE